jgi:hypothetical protein
LGAVSGAALALGAASPTRADDAFDVYAPERVVRKMA